MGFCNNLKIGNKLILGFSAVVAMTLSMGVIGYFQIQAQDRADDFLFEKGAKPLEHIGDIATDFQRLRVNVREFILAKEQQQNDYYAGRIVNPLRQVLDAVGSQQESGKEKARLAEAVSKGDLGQAVAVAEPLKIDTDRVGRDESGALLRAIVGMSEVQYSLDKAFAEMTDSLRHNREEETKRDWFKNGQSKLSASRYALKTAKWRRPAARSGAKPTSWSG